jgi:hypothetical protein
MCVDIASQSKGRNSNHSAAASNGANPSTAKLGNNTWPSTWAWNTPSAPAADSGKAKDPPEIPSRLYAFDATPLFVSDGNLYHTQADEVRCGSAVDRAAFSLA